MPQIAIILIMFRGANNFSFLPKNADGERESILLRTCVFLSCEDQVICVCTALGTLGVRGVRTTALRASLVFLLRLSWLWHHCCIHRLELCCFSSTPQTSSWGRCRSWR